MKVDQGTLAYIENVVATARLVGIDGVIIEPNRVRGVHEDSTVVLLQNTNVPELPFGSIGLNRTDVFSSRYAIAKSIPNFEMDATVDGPEEAQFARALTMKAKGTKIDYRCANPATIRAPKGFGDPITYRAQMHPEAVMYMQKAAGAMESDELSLIGTTDSITFEVTDINGDKMTYQFGDSVEIVNQEAAESRFSFRYPIKLLQTVFKSNADGYFHITKRGLLRASVNNLDIYIMPRT